MSQVVDIFCNCHNGLVKWGIAEDEAQGWIDGLIALCPPDEWADGFRISEPYDESEIPNHIPKRIVHRRISSPSGLRA